MIAIIDGYILYNFQACTTRKTQGCKTLSKHLKPVCRITPISPTYSKSPSEDCAPRIDAFIRYCSVKLTDIRKQTRGGAEKIFPCPYCNLVFMKVKKLVLHKREKHEREFFKETWREKVKQQKEERKRRKSGYSVRKLPRQTWKHSGTVCPYCKHKPRTGLFMIHQNRCRRQRENRDSCTGGCLTGEDQYSCPYCGGWYINGNLLKAHVKLLHSRPEKVKETKRQCDQCSKTFLNIKYLSYHRELAHSEVIDKDLDLESNEDNADAERGCEEAVTETENRVHDNEPDIENDEEIIMGADDAKDVNEERFAVSDSEIEIPKRQRRNVQKLLSSSLDESGDGFISEKTYECMDCGKSFQSIGECRHLELVCELCGIKCKQVMLVLQWKHTALLMTLLQTQNQVTSRLVRKIRAPK